MNAPTTVPTSSKEQAVIGSVLDDSTAVEQPAVAALIRGAPDSFRDLRCGQVARVMHRLTVAGERASLLAVRRLLNGDPDANKFLPELLRQSLPPALAEAEAEELLQGWQTRRVQSIFAEANEAVISTPHLCASIARHTRDALAELDGKSSVTAEARPWLDVAAPLDNFDVLVGPGRWLTRGSGALLCGPTGCGKSTLTATLAFSWGLGRQSLGLVPNARLRSVVIQAEDDLGDLGDMRSGVISVLAPTESELAALRENVLVLTERSKTGLEFLRLCVAPALRNYRPHLVWLNPVSAFFGADLNCQRDVAEFFRGGLNRLLVEFECAVIAVHHVAKPSQERANWRGAQLAYSGAGSADLGNWAREILALRETTPGLYELTCCKRWRKLGWTDSEGRPTATRLVAHSRDGSMVWRDATPSVLEELGAVPYSDDALLALVPDAGSDAAELVRLVADRFALSERTAARYVADSRRLKRRRHDGQNVRTVLLTETRRPRREVYPDRPTGRDVIWLTKQPVNAKC